MRRKGENAMKSTPASFPQRATSVPIVRLSEGDTLAEHMGQMSAAIARRAYELFEARGFEDGHDWQDWFRAESELLAPVPVKVAETDQELHVRAEVPGFTDKDVEVRVEPRRLIICGKKQQTSEQDKGRAVRKVEKSDEFVRVVDLPHEIDPDKVRATLENEMLTITLRKVNPSTKTPVGIKAA
jgi:HSP20 family protein